jgi:hypothetical protein
MLALLVVRDMVLVTDRPPPVSSVHHVLKRQLPRTATPMSPFPRCTKAVVEIFMKARIPVPNRSAVRQELAHYVRVLPAASSITSIIQHANRMAFGDPVEDLQLLESIVPRCREAGHYCKVFRMSAAEARETLAERAKLEHEQRNRDKRKKATAQGKPAPAETPFDAAAYRQR